jgi:hypothetical protein
MTEYMALPVDEFEKLKSENDQMSRMLKLIADDFWPVEDHEIQRGVVIALLITLGKDGA